MVRITSTSFMIGTGLKKCSPTKRCGRCVTMAISVIEIEDVLLAKIVLPRADFVKRDVKLLFRRQLLDDRFDDDVASSADLRGSSCRADGRAPRRGQPGSACLW